VRGEVVDRAVGRLVGEQGPAVQRPARDLHHRVVGVAAHGALERQVRQQHAPGGRVGRLLIDRCRRDRLKVALLVRHARAGGRGVRRLELG
jgi:hypothetical protein